VVHRDEASAAIGRSGTYQTSSCGNPVASDFVAAVEHRRWGRTPMNEATRKLDALMKRQAALSAALRAEREKQKEIEEKMQERLIRIVGRAVLANAEQSPEFKQFLIGVLRTTVTVESEAKFLTSRNLL
jgi:hypothetical protein